MGWAGVKKADVLTCKERRFTATNEKGSFDEERLRGDLQPLPRADTEVEGS